MFPTSVMLPAAALVAIAPPPPPPPPPAAHFCGAATPDDWPQFHLSDADAKPSAHDANGIFSHGEYRHVMNQRADASGATGWGHVVSTDWVRWERLPLAIPPSHGGQNYDGGVGIVNGVPVLMWDCTNDPVCSRRRRQSSRRRRAAAGLRGDPPIVGLARPADVGNDPKLTSWTKDPHNPIVVDKGVGHYNAPSNIWSPVPGRWDVLFCLGWDRSWKGNVTTALYTTTDPMLHSWRQKTAGFFSPHYGGGGSFWPIPGVGAEAPVSHMLSADFHGDGHGTFALGRYDPVAETFSGATEQGGVVDFSADVRYFELGTSPPAAPVPANGTDRLVMVGWTSAGTAMTMVREISFDPELRQLLAVPVAELAGLRGARIDDGSVGPGRPPRTLAPAERLIVARGGLVRTVDLELVFAVPATGPWQATVAALDGSAVLTLSGGGAGGAAAVQARLPGMKAPYAFALKPGETSITVRVLADKVIAEFFVQGGRAVGTYGLKGGVAAANATLAVSADAGSIALTSVAAWAMGCGWV